MFSLIITIISIALVAALALATIYYGGAAFNKSATSANAAKIATQSQQLLGAATLYKADHGDWPPTLQHLVDGNYLKSIPLAFNEQPGAVSSAYAAGVEWTMPEPGVPTFVLVNSVDIETCRETNRKLRGDDGILEKAYVAFQAQCFGPGPEDLTVLITADPSSMHTALPAGTVVNTAPPALPGSGSGTEDPAAWYVQPGATSPAGSGGTGGTGGSALTWDSEDGVLQNTDYMDRFINSLQLNVWAPEGSTLVIETARAVQGGVNVPASQVNCSGTSCNLQFGEYYQLNEWQGFFTNGGLVEGNVTFEITYRVNGGQLQTTSTTKPYSVLQVFW